MPGAVSAAPTSSTFTRAVVSAQGCCAFHRVQKVLCALPAATITNCYLPGLPSLWSPATLYDSMLNILKCISCLCQLWFVAYTVSTAAYMCCLGCTVVARIGQGVKGCCVQLRGPQWSPGVKQHPVPQLGVDREIGNRILPQPLHKALVVDIAQGVRPNCMTQQCEALNHALQAAQARVKHMKAYGWLAAGIAALHMTPP